MIATYQIAAQKPKDSSQEGKTNFPSKDEGPVYFLIPQYYKFLNCRTWTRSRCRDYRENLGEHLETGVSRALSEISLGRQVVLTGGGNAQSLVCSITVMEQPVSDTTLYIELLGALTMGMSPVYATREYVLSYRFYLDPEMLREYQYTITRKAIRGVLSGVLVPVVYPFWGDEIAILDDGPSAKVIREITRTVLIDARRDGIL
jgi:hypothetical protein